MIDVEPTAAEVAITSRSGERQAHMTKEDVAKLREGYLQVCDVVRAEFDVPAHIVDGSADTDAQAEAALAFVQDYARGAAT